ncbi:WD repeat-containing protein 49 [Cichlidogyrus casuarinus]|uniref:WD repeat-containing protein 49 n=1 Tax=Cichlidogyrus casuarinus TaxID=1844966 RepID=A0ABD2Q6V1_9PLAT
MLPDSPTNTSEKTYSRKRSTTRDKTSDTLTQNSSLDAALTIEDVKRIQLAFYVQGPGGTEQSLNLSRAQFTEAMSMLMPKLGSIKIWSELFDSIDTTSENFVNWDKLANYWLLKYYERDIFSLNAESDWSSLKYLSPTLHHSSINRFDQMKNTNKYFSLSKDGTICFWTMHLKLFKTIRVTTDSCMLQDQWATDCVYMPHINKMVFAFTTNEIMFCNMNLKLDLTPQLKLVNLSAIPRCLHFWWDEENPNNSILCWGDVEGYLNIIVWSVILPQIFDKLPQSGMDKEDSVIEISVDEIKNEEHSGVIFHRVEMHKEWIRRVQYIPNLEAFVSCSFCSTNSMVIRWFEITTDEKKTSRARRKFTRKSTFSVSMGINAFDYHPGLNLLATAQVNNNVNLWNPYVSSKPSGLLRGHLSPVLSVKFHTKHSKLISLCQAKTIRVWDIQMQIGLHRIAGIFPKGIDLSEGVMFLHENSNKLFITFKTSVVYLEMLQRDQNRLLTQKPVIGLVYNKIMNQVITAYQDGKLIFWALETGNRVRNSPSNHNKAELTCFVQDASETRLFTGGTDGTVRVCDLNGQLLHTLICFGGSPAEVSQILVLKRIIIVMGGGKKFILFRSTNFRDSNVYPSEWKGGIVHNDEVIAGCAIPPHSMITGSSDGELIQWNINSELPLQRMQQRMRPPTASDEDNFMVTRLIAIQSRYDAALANPFVANLVSCSSGSVVRFWNTFHANLLSEFISHEKGTT